MGSTLISQFIDDELKLDEKERFVKGVRQDGGFYDETLELLAQESLLRQMEGVTPEVEPLLPRRRRVAWRPVVALAASLVILLLSVLALVPENPPSVTHRFLIHAPEVDTVAVMGDFTSWSPLALTRVGVAGYWELTLHLSPGVHRYAFLMNGDLLAPDPTVVAREGDDFGGMNSILRIKEEA
ncbi:glycogen-binding domain-containing protein [Desulfoluna sp.]|uniref:glycogen-binding domain-containing protein n=1 Tax=Desulfoluna sp. TaxID=2045199 RepID=UPI002637FC94|nr:glycogen-binding domain-containing protein [Desulfoluna sp.]